MAEQITKTSVDLLDGTPTSVSGQGVLPSMQTTMGCAAVSTKLSAKHDKFCWEYIATCGNGTKAYMRVYPGTSEAAARAHAARLVAKGNIKARIEEMLQENRNRHVLIQDKVIEYHRSVMMLDRYELLDPETGRVKKLDDLPPEAREVIEVEQVSAKDGVRTLLKIPTRHSSAQELARVLGMNKESMELTGKDGGPVAVSPSGDAEALEALRQAFNKHATSSP